jgi:hypothetical protein
MQKNNLEVVFGSVKPLSTPVTDEEINQIIAEEIVKKYIQKFPFFKGVASIARRGIRAKL